jgi:hypothetical protein
MGHRYLKFSWVKERATQAAQASRPIIHSRAQMRENSFMPGEWNSRWDLPNQKKMFNANHWHFKSNLNLTHSEAR